MHKFGCTEISGLRHVVATGVLNEAEETVWSTCRNIVAKSRFQKNVGEGDIWYGKHECDGNHLLMVLWLNN